MQVGFSLLETNEDGSSKEIPSIVEDTELTEPLIVEVPEANSAESTRGTVSLEELVDFKHEIMKEEGINKDFALSLESMIPNVLKNNGLYLNGFSECLSKINFEQTVKIIDKEIGIKATAQTVSMEDIDVATINESVTDDMKKKWNADKGVYENLTEEELVAFGKIIAYKMYHNLNTQATNNLYNTVLSGAGEIQYVNGVPAIVTNPAFQAPSSVMDVAPAVVSSENYSEEGFKEILNKIKRAVGLKDKTKADYLASFNLVHNVLGSNFEEKFIQISKAATDIGNLLKNQHALNDEIMARLSDIYIAMVEQEKYKESILTSLDKNIKEFIKNESIISKKMENTFTLDISTLKSLGAQKEPSKDYSKFDKLKQSDELIKAVNEFIDIGSSLHIKYLYEVNLMFTDTYTDNIIPFIIEDDDNGIINNEFLDVIEKSNSKIAFNALYNLMGCAWAIIYRE